MTTSTMPNSFKHVKLRSGKEFDLAFIPTIGSEEELAQAACFSCLADQSPESCAIYSGALLDGKCEVRPPKNSQLISQAQRVGISGINLQDRFIRQGSLELIEAWLEKMGGSIHNRTRLLVSQILGRGHTAVVIADQEHDIGVIELALPETSA
jgi:potassium-transporting ATPase ATP-binding subunit